MRGICSAAAIVALFALIACTNETSERAASVRQIVSSAYGGNAPGGAVMVLDGDEILIAEGFGLADLEWNIPADETTSFRVGSISKPITAIAILRMVELNRLELDAPASHYIADLPGVLGQPTLRQLLSHTSGLPDHFALPEVQQNMRNPATFDQLVAIMADVELLFEPGSNWSYSNFNYVLLGGILEAIDPERRSYGEIIEQDIFALTGMANSHFDRQRTVIQNRARGYDHDGHGPINTIALDTSNVGAAGALMLSAEDYGLLSQSLINGELLSAEMRALAWTEVTLPDGTGTGYGLGFNLSELMDETAIWHSGSINGFQSTWIHLPDRRLTVATLSNGYYRPNSTTTARRVLAALSDRGLPALETVEIGGTDLSDFEARYQLSDDRLLQVHVEDGVRFSIDEGGWDELHWAGGDILFLPDSLLHLAFQRDSAGSIVGLEYVNGSLSTTQGRRLTGAITGAVRSVELDLDAARAVVGRWMFHTGDAAIIELVENQLSVQLPAQPPARLFQAEDGSYFSRAVPLTIRFSPDGSSAHLSIYGYPYDLVRP